MKKKEIPIVHAHWEWYPDRCDRHVLLCSNCEKEATRKNQKYCPHCKAKMDEVVK